MELAQLRFFQNCDLFWFFFHSFIQIVHRKEYICMYVCIQLYMYINPKKKLMIECVFCCKERERKIQKITNSSYVCYLKKQCAFCSITISTLQIYIALYNVKNSVYVLLIVVLIVFFSLCRLTEAKLFCIDNKYLCMK